MKLKCTLHDSLATGVYSAYSCFAGGLAATQLLWERRQQGSKGCAVQWFGGAVKGWDGGHVAMLNRGGFLGLVSAVLLGGVQLIAGCADRVGGRGTPHLWSLCALGLLWAFLVD